MLDDVVREALAPVLLGLGIGLVLSAALTRLLGSVTFGVAPLDPVAFGAAPGLLLPVAVAAALLPGLRATRVHPVQALRHD